MGAWEQYTSHQWCKLGALSSTILLGIDGHSIPSFTLVDNGLRVLVTNETGTVPDFGVVPASWDAVLDEVNGRPSGRSAGFRAASTFRDFNDDGLLDVVVGIQMAECWPTKAALTRTTALADANQADVVERHAQSRTG